jgi:hypothetical protein
LIACGAISLAVAHFSKPYRADKFINHWAGIFASNRSPSALRNLPQKERPDLIYIREFENGQWFAARTEYACGDGAGFDATVFADSDGMIHFQKGYHFCGHEALGSELGFQGVTNLAGLYPQLKGFGLKRWPTGEETKDAL